MYQASLMNAGSIVILALKYVLMIKVVNLLALNFSVYCMMLG